MARFERSILPQDSYSDWGQYGPPPPKPAHGRIRTDYNGRIRTDYNGRIRTDYNGRIRTDYNAPTRENIRTYPLNEGQTYFSPPLHQNELFPVPYNRQNDGFDEQDPFLPHQFQDGGRNEADVIRRRGSSNRKKFVHFRESRDVTYYPELYQAEKVYPDGDLLTTSFGVGSHAHFETPTPEPEPDPFARTREQHTYQLGDMAASVVDHNQLDVTGRTGSDQWSYKGSKMVKTFGFDGQADNIYCSSPFEEIELKRNTDFTVHPYQERMATTTGEWITHVREGEMKLNSSKLSQCYPPVSVCETESLLPNTELKVSAIGPVYLINRNSATRSSGTFISLIGRAPVDPSQEKESRMYQRTFAKEAAAQKRKSEQQTTFATQKTKREVKVDTGYFVQEEGDREVKDVKRERKSEEITKWRPTIKALH